MEKKLKLPRKQKKHFNNWKKSVMSTTWSPSKPKPTKHEKENALYCSYKAIMAYQGGDKKRLKPIFNTED